ncbi:hypothetical protein D3C71_1707390 [compost metagenome]
MRQHESQHLGQAVAHGLEVVLERQIVGQVQLADARGIAAAAQVLEQQGVVQAPELVLGQAQALPQLRAYPAAARAMALGLAFGDVESVAQGRDQL